MRQVNERKQQHLSRKQWLVVIAVVLAVAIWVGINAVTRLQVALQPPPPQAPAPLAVEVQVVEHSPFAGWARYAAVLAAEQETVLQSRLTAQILAMPVRSGDRVERGDLIVRLDDAELRGEVARLQAAGQGIEAELALAQTLLERRRKLFAVAAAAAEQVDEAQARVESLVASRAENRQAIQVATSRLGYAQLHAPFAGVVGRLFALPGDLAAPGRALVELIDPLQLKVEFTVPQQDLARVAQGQSAHVRIPARDLALDGQVDRLHPRLELPGRGAQAEIVLPTATAGLLPGMTAEVHLLTEHRDEAVVIPVAALQRRDEGAHVFLFDAGTARRRAVTPGPEDQGRVVIEAGLVAGERLILTPHPGLADGRAVVAVQRP